MADKDEEMKGDHQDGENEKEDEQMEEEIKKFSF